MDPYKALKNAVANNRLSHAYLLTGGHIEKNQAATFLAQSRFCKSLSAEGEPCGKCSNCERIASGTHPNVKKIARQDSQMIKVDQIRDMKAQLAMSGAEEKAQVFIVEEAEKINASSGASLLKVLEEPAAGDLLILLTDAPNQMLPTIISRVQIIKFDDVEDEFDEEMRERLQVVNVFLKRLIAKNPRALTTDQIDLVNEFKTKDEQKLSLKYMLTLEEAFLFSPAGKRDLPLTEKLLSETSLAEKMMAFNVSYKNVLMHLASKIVLGV
ncbi:MAG: hypothetical protein LBN08_04850 [Lactobacillales bacterium]|jgi:DNA polymerase-3 subunit delta'|nr:hypothetical protein [Lactobacillales bacterium]